MKITSPAEGYTGKDRYGETVLDFQDGVAEHEGDLPDGIRQYLQGAGYGIGSSKPTQPEPVEIGDPRDYEENEVVGTRLRDAAVDPKPEDFLAPINAGEANPHGPKVVSPEIHASGPAGIRPGDVFVDDTDKQEVREKAFAEARLIDGATAAEANRAEVPDIDDFGPLGLSDPGSVEQGVEGAKEVAKAEKAEASAEVVDDEPAPAKKAPAKKTAAKKSAAKKS
jgi:hypothetical protein